MCARSLVGSDQLSLAPAAASMASNGHPENLARTLPGPPGIKGFGGPGGAPGFRPLGMGPAGFPNPAGPWQDAPGFQARPGPPGAGLHRGPPGFGGPLGTGAMPGFRPGMDRGPMGGPPGGPPGGTLGTGGLPPLAGELDSLLTHKSARDRAKTEKCVRQPSSHLAWRASHEFNLSCLLGMQGALLPPAHRGTESV